MSRRLIRWVAILQISLTVLTGCSPTRPIFRRNNPALANYLDQAMSIEYADVEHNSLPEATQTFEPFSHERMPERFHYWTLEDCISIGLQNAKMLISTPGVNLQSGSMASSFLSAQPGQLPSVYDPAIVALTGNTQPLIVDNQGTRISQRGSVRANQVGGVEQALSEFDAQYSTVFGYNTTDRPRNVGRGNVFNPQFFKATDATLQNALSKRLATGTVVTARTSTVYSRNNIPASGNAIGSTNFGRSVPSDYTATIELQLNQPLMRGRGTLVNRIPVVLGRINEDISLHQFEANVRNLLRDIEHAYWDLYLGYRAVETARIARDSALRLWRVAKERERNSDTTPAAVAQAEGRVAQFEAQLKIAINGSNVPGNDPLGLIGRERVLREKLGLAPTDGHFICPTDLPTEARIQFDWDSIRDEALHRNTEIRISKWAIKQRELELISAKNQLLPQLDLVGVYRWVGVGDNLISSRRTGLTFPNPGSNAIENLLTEDYEEVGARIEYTPTPFGARREKGNVLAQQMSLAKAHKELEAKELALGSLLSGAWTNMNSGLASAIDFQRQSLANQDEIKVYLEQIDSSTGDIGQLLDALLRAQEQLARSQLLYFQSVVEYNKSIVNIHYLKGSLLDLNNVSLGEGAWVEKAYWDAEQRAQERASGLYFDYGYTRPGVVSRGPVEAGGTTEGNISDTAPRLRNAEQVQAQESDEPSDSTPKKKSESEMKSTNRPNNVQRPSASRGDKVSSVKSVTSEAPVVPADQFQWGEMGLNEKSSSGSSQSQMRPVIQNDLRQVPASNKLNYGSSGSTESSFPDSESMRSQNQGAEIRWKSRS